MRNARTLPHFQVNMDLYFHLLGLGLSRIVTLLLIIQCDLPLLHVVWAHHGAPYIALGKEG